jgi:hypothetical protein
MSVSVPSTRLDSFARARRDWSCHESMWSRPSRVGLGRVQPDQLEQPVSKVAGQLQIGLA